MASGFSYRKYLIAYGSDLQKFYFPYEFIADVEKLQSEMPEHQAFYSSLTKSNITKEEYEFVTNIWIEKGCWSTLKDMSIYDNLLDCVPFVTTFGNLLVPYNKKIWISSKEIFFLVEWPNCK